MKNNNIIYIDQWIEYKQNYQNNKAAKSFNRDKPIKQREQVLTGKIVEFKNEDELFSGMLIW